VSLNMKPQEVGMKAHLQGLFFRKATRSQYTWNQCVEVAIEKEFVAVRNSRDPGGDILQFSHEEWDAFVDGVKNNEFNIS